MANSETFGWAMMGLASLDLVNAGLLELYNDNQLPHVLSYSASTPVNTTLQATLGAPTLNGDVGTQTDAINVVFPVSSGTLVLGNTSYPLHGTATFLVQLSYVDVEVQEQGAERQVFVDLTNVKSVDTSSFDLGNAVASALLEYAFSAYVQQYFEQHNGQAVFTLGSVNINNLSGVFPKGLVPTFAQFASYLDPNDASQSAIVAMIATDGSPDHGADPIFSTSLLPSGSQAAVYFSGAVVLTALVIPPAADGLGVSATQFKVSDQPVRTQMQGKFTKHGAVFKTFGIVIDSDAIRITLEGTKKIVVDYNITGTDQITASITSDEGVQTLAFTASKPDVHCDVSNDCAAAVLNAFTEGMASLFYRIIEGKIKGKVSQAMGSALHSALPSLKWNYADLAQLHSVHLPGDVVVGLNAG